MKRVYNIFVINRTIQTVVIYVLRGWLTAWRRPGVTWAYSPSDLIGTAQVQLAIIGLRVQTHGWSLVQISMIPGYVHIKNLIFLKRFRLFKVSLKAMHEASGFNPGPGWTMDLWLLLLPASFHPFSESNPVPLMWHWMSPSHPGKPPEQIHFETWYSLRQNGKCKLDSFSI